MKGAKAGRELRLGGLAVAGLGRAGTGLELAEPSFLMRPQSISERISGGGKPSAICPWAGLLLSAAPRKPSPDFATGLIAAKPLKPCDGGVFGALNLLLKKE